MGSIIYVKSTNNGYNTNKETSTYTKHYQELLIISNSFSIMHFLRTNYLQNFLTDQNIIQSKAKSQALNQLKIKINLIIHIEVKRLKEYDRAIFT